MHPKCRLCGFVTTCSESQTDAESPLPPRGRNFNFFAAVIHSIPSPQHLLMVFLFFSFFEGCHSCGATGKFCCFGVFLSSLEAVQCCFPLPFSSSFSPFHPNSYNLCFCINFRWEKKWKKFFSLSIKQTQAAEMAICGSSPLLFKLPSISYIIFFFSVEAIHSPFPFFFFFWRRRSL